MNRPIAIIALSLLTACDPSSSDQDAGQETSACLEGACFGELECLSNLCVAPDGDTDGDGDGDGDEGMNASDDTSGADDTDPPDGDPSGGSSGSGPDDEPSDPPGGGACSLPAPSSCDEGNPSVSQALGVCGGSMTVSAEGAAESIGLRNGFGPTPKWDPTEGSAFVAIGSGLVAELDFETPDSEDGQVPTYCSDNTGGADGAELPEPIETNPIQGCVDNPANVGLGDCSQSLGQAFGDGTSIFDYAGVRIEATVPEGVRALSYDFAFLSTEYPAYTNSSFNDMHLGWLESEMWTGNVAYDDQGGLVTVNSSFLDIVDDELGLERYEGTCMRGHGGTQWLRTTAPVAPGEDVVLVLAVFDMADPAVDSFTFLDNVSWSCDAVAEPQTVKLEG